MRGRFFPLQLLFLMQANVVPVVLSFPFDFPWLSATLSQIYLSPKYQPKADIAEYKVLGFSASRLERTPAVSRECPILTCNYHD